MQPIRYPPIPSLHILKYRKPNHGVMSIIKSACRFASKELDAILVLDKRVHHTLVYGITHLRNNGRKMVMKTSETLSRLSEE